MRRGAADRRRIGRARHVIASVKRWLDLLEKGCFYAGSMDFELIGEVRDIQPIAIGGSVRELARLRRRYGRGRWRKLKGIARVRLMDGTIRTAEVHWYEAHGIGRKELKIKFPLLD